MPYPFYTPDNIAWKEFAENADTGASSNFLKKVRNFERKINCTFMSVEDSTLC